MPTEINILQGGDGRFCLTITDADDQTAELFEELELQGGGYTWEGIVAALVQMHMPQSRPQIKLGAEADNMYAYCHDRVVLQQVADLVRAACIDHKLLKAAIAQAGEGLE